MLRRLLAVAALVSGLLPVAAKALPGASDPSIVVGVIATLSGPGAMAGQDMVDGFTLALKQLGGRFSNQEVRLALNDDKGLPDVALRQVQRLVERERLDIVLTGTSPSSMAAIAKPLVAAHLFVLGLNDLPSDLGGSECSPWLFGMAAPVDGAHEAMGQHLAAERLRRVVVVGRDTSFTRDAVTALKRTFPGEISALLTPAPGASTFDKELERIAAIKPDAVYTLLAGGMGVKFVRAYAASGLKAEIPLFATWSAFERPSLVAMGDAALDVVSIATWNPDLESTSNKKFNGDFESEYGRPVTIWAAQGYDAAMLLDSALKATRGRTGDSESLRAALRRADFPSLRGAFKFNYNHSPVLSYYVRKVGRDPKGRLINESRGAVLKDWRDRQAHSCAMRWVEEPLPPVVVKKP